MNQTAFGSTFPVFTFGSDGTLGIGTTNLTWATSSHWDHFALLFQAFGRVAVRVCGAVAVLATRDAGSALTGGYGMAVGT